MTTTQLSIIIVEQQAATPAYVIGVDYGTDEQEYELADALKDGGAQASLNFVCRVPLRSTRNDNYSIIDNHRGTTSRYSCLRYRC